MFKRKLIFFVVLCGVRANAADQEALDLEQPKVHAPQIARGVAREGVCPQPVKPQIVMGQLNDSVKVVKVTAFERPKGRVHVVSVSVGSTAEE